MHRCNSSRSLYGAHFLPSGASTSCEANPYVPQPWLMPPLPEHAYFASEHAYFAGATASVGLHPHGCERSLPPSPPPDGLLAELGLWRAQALPPIGQPELAHAAAEHMQVRRADAPLRPAGESARVRAQPMRMARPNGALPFNTRRQRMRHAHSPARARKSLPPPCSARSSSGPSRPQAAPSCCRMRSSARRPSASRSRHCWRALASGATLPRRRTNSPTRCAANAVGRPRS